MTFHSISHFLNLILIYRLICVTHLISVIWLEDFVSGVWFRLI